VEYGPSPGKSGSTGPKTLAEDDDIDRGNGLTANPFFYLSDDEWDEVDHAPAVVHDPHRESEGIGAMVGEVAKKAPPTLKYYREPESIGTVDGEVAMEAPPKLEYRKVKASKQMSSENVSIPTCQRYIENALSTVANGAGSSDKSHKKKPKKVKHVSQVKSESKIIKYSKNADGKRSSGMDYIFNAVGHHVTPNQPLSLIGASKLLTPSAYKEFVDHRQRGIHLPAQHYMTRGTIHRCCMVKRSTRGTLRALEAEEQEPDNPEDVNEEEIVFEANEDPPNIGDPQTPPRPRSVAARPPANDPDAVSAREDPPDIQQPIIRRPPAQLKNDDDYPGDSEFENPRHVAEIHPRDTAQPRSSHNPRQPTPRTTYPPDPPIFVTMRPISTPVPVPTRRTYREIREIDQRVAAVTDGDDVYSSSSGDSSSDFSTSDDSGYGRNRHDNDRLVHSDPSERFTADNNATKMSHISPLAQGRTQHLPFSGRILVHHISGSGYKF
jgi:hypothetical protein